MLESCRSISTFSDIKCDTIKCSYSLSFIRLLMFSTCIIARMSLVLSFIIDKKIREGVQSVVQVHQQVDQFSSGESNLPTFSYHYFSWVFYPLVVVMDHPSFWVFLVSVSTTFSPHLTLLEELHSNF